MNPTKLDRLALTVAAIVIVAFFLAINVILAGREAQAPDPQCDGPFVCIAQLDTSQVLDRR